MQPNLEGVRIAVLGGDAREIVLTSELLRLGAKVQAVGVPVQGLPNVTVCYTVADALKGVQAVILPVAGINRDGTVYSVFSEKPLELSEKLLVSLPAQAPVFAGFARERLIEMVGRCNLKLVEVLKKMM